MYWSVKKKDNISEAECVEIGNFLRSFYPNSSMPKVRHLGEAMIIRQQINTPNNPQFRNIEFVDGRPRWGDQKVDYVKSNLAGDRGAVFYFRCNNCHGRAKYLYFFLFRHNPICRICSGLKYYQANRRKRSFTRALNRKYLSAETKYALMKKANITREDIANYLSDNCKE